MNRKERLKITRTPEKGFVYANESLYLPSPKPKMYAEKTEKDVLPFKVENETNWKETIKKYAIYAHIIIPYLLVLYMYFNSKETTVSKLIEEINSLKSQRVMETRTKKRLYNVARIEFGTTVSIEEGLYKYGLYGLRTYNDPNIILNDNFSPGDCLAINKDSGSIKILFKCNLLISKIGIFHPETNKRESSIREFEIIDSSKPTGTLLGRFVYDPTKDKYQYFDFKTTLTDQIKIKILSNNGNPKYTTLYKIFVYGRVEN
ncbi:Sperm-associated antigen 4 protein [Nosema granulosis]|uniref:Sperm-associated antigen 4 protein n=1 Tax=Nosema granulosis TaxID=83296 RepID=A0A9P6H019_9MICR|nr:Sperm-associated antigen 4 protein [Nosema granulosis]